MTNKQIAKSFLLLSQLMELHSENPYKIRSYSTAYNTLRKLGADLNEMSLEELKSIPGVGDAISSKIAELLAKGNINELEEYKNKTPEGIQQMLSIKGLGIKKIQTIWHKMEITTVGELLYACNENRLVDYEGFGQKTQEDLKQKIDFFQRSLGKHLYANILPWFLEIIDKINIKLPNSNCAMTGQIRRAMPIIEELAVVLMADKSEIEILKELGDIEFHEENKCILSIEDEGELILYFSSKEAYPSLLFNTTGPSAFLKQFASIGDNDVVKWENLSPIYRDNDVLVNNFIQSGSKPKPVEYSDLRGVLHNHSTWSDGVDTLEEFGNYVKEQGFEYLGISDHSRSAGYAGGLSIERVKSQWDAIDTLNLKWSGKFKILKGIESDILIDGSLDYPDEILEGFDFVVASIHSVLQMDEVKATNRLIKAIEHPSTKILGHPTGRLLLARAGYPVNMPEVIEACAYYNVVIELNANPNRLDLDWTWIPYAVEKGVKISINPDAHYKEAISDMKYGILAAQKASLQKEMCLNSLNLKEISAHFSTKKL